MEDAGGGVKVGIGGVATGGGVGVDIVETANGTDVDMGAGNFVASGVVDGTPAVFVAAGTGVTAWEARLPGWVTATGVARGSGPPLHDAKTATATISTMTHCTVFCITLMRQEAWDLIAGNLPGGVSARGIRNSLKSILGRQTS